MCALALAPPLVAQSHRADFEAGPNIFASMLASATRFVSTCAWLCVPGFRSLWAAVAKMVLLEQQLVGELVGAQEELLVLCKQKVFRATALPAVAAQL